MKIELMEHQRKALEAVANYNRCAFYHSMGLGKTYTGSEKLMSFHALNNLIVCQKSKIKDWLDHMSQYYDLPVYNLTKKKDYEAYCSSHDPRVGVINYDLLTRRPNLVKLKHLSVIYDESSLIKRASAQRTKVALKMDYDHLVLLSGTPTGGQYEHLWSQCKLLGMNLSNDAFSDRYVIYRDFWPPKLKWPIPVVCGYKRIDELITRMHQLGAHFLKTEDVLTLPEQVFTFVDVEPAKEYKKFVKDLVVEIDGVTLSADNLMTKLLYARMLASGYNKNKEQALADLIESTNERLVIFYNYNNELEAIKRCVGDRPMSLVKGGVTDLKAYEECDNSITVVNSQAGAKGLNLQKACRLVVFAPTLRAEDHMQMLKRIHRIGQKRTCFYYFMRAIGTVEEDIYKTLDEREDYTMKLFEQTYG